MKELKRQLEADSKKRLNEVLDRNNTEWLERNICNRKTPYIKDRDSKVVARVREIYKKELNAKLDRINEISSSNDKMSNDLVLIINFYKSSTKGSDNYGHITDSIKGSGYCKESTATAQLLNQNDVIMKKLYEAKNMGRDLGYGSGYGILPSFEGGVGVSCHVNILEKLGYKVTVSGNNFTTVMTVQC